MYLLPRFPCSISPVLTFILQSSAVLLCNYSPMVAEQNIFLPWCNSVCLDSARTSESFALASLWQPKNKFLSGAAWLEWDHWISSFISVFYLTCVSERLCWFVPGKLNWRAKWWCPDQRGKKKWFLLTWRRECAHIKSRTGDNKAINKTTGL